MADNQEYTSEDIREHFSELTSRSYSDLKSCWYDTVGRWLISRTELYDDDTDIDTWLQEQYEKVKHGHKTDYGFIVTVLPPKPEQAA